MKKIERVFRLQTAWFFIRGFKPSVYKYVRNTIKELGYFHFISQVSVLISSFYPQPTPFLFLPRGRKLQYRHSRTESSLPLQRSIYNTGFTVYSYSPVIWLDFLALKTSRNRKVETANSRNLPRNKNHWKQVKISLVWA